MYVASKILRMASSTNVKWHKITNKPTLELNASRFRWHSRNSNLLTLHNPHSHSISEIPYNLYVIGLSVSHNRFVTSAKRLVILVVSCSELASEQLKMEVGWWRTSGFDGPAMAADCGLLRGLCVILQQNNPFTADASIQEPRRIYRLSWCQTHLQYDERVKKRVKSL